MVVTTAASTTTRVRHGESGMALVIVMLVMMLGMGLMAGMFAAVSSDARTNSFDKDQSQAYAAAHAGLEKLTATLGRLFDNDPSPNAAQINALTATPPVISGIEYTSAGGGTGYTVTFTPDPCTCPNAGNPLPDANSNITTGPYEGLRGIITPYTIQVTAKTTGGAEVRLRRQIQTVAIPVFQFGVFGERSVSFHAGANFDFGGRVHTNANLYLAAGTGFTATFRDRLTAVGQVIRQTLENGNAVTNSGHTGNVSLPVVVGSTFRNMAATEGSVTGGLGSAAWAGWQNLSTTTYNLNIRNTMTGARALNLPLVSQGAQPIDLIRRPLINSNEDAVSPQIFRQRFYSQASLRILLSDRASDITSLPGVTADAPVALTGNWINPAEAPAGYVVGAGRTPLARAIGASSTTISGAASSYAAPYHQLNVTAVPAAMQMPVLTVAGVGNVTCGGKTASTFIRCNVTAAIAAGAAITVVTQGGNTVSTTSTGAVGIGAAQTITTPANGTLPFSHGFAWINDRTSNVPYPMTCEGYDTGSAPQRLTNCRILGITVAQTTAGRVISTYSDAPANTSLLGGFIKIEKQNAGGAWTDVTNEILGLGFAAPNQEGTLCADPTPDAVIRLQRLRDNGGACSYAGSTDSRDYWPNALFDAREGSFRDLATTAPATMGGLMNYVTLDVGNLKRWLNGTIGTTGAQAWDNNGYIVYFSDRRGNHNDGVANSPETGEYGNEDSINSGAGAASSAANGALDGGEDRNEDNVLQTYGATPSALALYGGTAPFNNTATPLTNITNHPEARVNRQVLFRRALKITNGGINAGVNNLPDTGLTIATENGAYVQGNYNAMPTDANAEPNRPASIIADAVTILSNNWLDVRSFTSPNDYTGRDATTTGYRFAVIAGKSIPFAKPAWAALGNWGTDGGIHNFMRMLEDWTGQTANYRGSIVSLYTARQMIGMFKNNANTYFQPTRNFAFDTDFLQPQLLPPGTPMFRDVNTLQFRQILRPNQ